MPDSQVPWGVDALECAVGEPAWRTKSSWYLVATDDRMIPPAAQRLMAQRAGAKVTENAVSRAIYVSRQDAGTTSWCAGYSRSTSRPFKRLCAIPRLSGRRTATTRRPAP